MAHNHGLLGTSLTRRPRGQTLAEGNDMKTQATLAILLAMCISAEALSIIDQPFRTLLLPRLAFTNASLTTVARTLEREYATHGHDRSPSRINILVHPSCTNVSVTLDLEHASVYGTLRVLNQMYEINHSIVDDNIILTKQPGGPMVTRIYDVLPSIFPGSHVGGTDVTAYFSRFGGAFSEGASAHHLPELGKLLVHNTLANIDELEHILACLNVVPCQIEMSVRVVRVDDPDLAVRAAHRPTPANVHAVVTSSDTLFRLTTVAASGQTVTNSLSTGPSGGKSIGAARGSAQFVMTPSVSPEGQLLTLPLQASLALPSGKHERIEYGLHTSLTLYNGASMMLWLSPPADAEGDNQTICLVVSARLIDPAGQPITESTVNILHELTE